MSSVTAEQQAEGLVLHSLRGRVALVATVAASAMASLDATVVNVALPHIGEEFDADISALQWVLTGYLVALASLILLGGALRYCRQQKSKKRVVTFVCDTGNKYLSKMYNDFWMAEQGFVERPTHGDLSDLISHRAEKGEVIMVGPDDTLLTAFKRMRTGDVSQLPVLSGEGRAVGIIDESDLLVKVHRDPAKFNDLVKGAMTDRLETLSPAANISDLLGVFDRGRVAIVMEGDKFLGLITRTDLLSFLRLHMPK